MKFLCYYMMNGKLCYCIEHDGLPTDGTGKSAVKYLKVIKIPHELNKLNLDELHTHYGYEAKNESV